MARRPSLGNISSPYGWRMHPLTRRWTHHDGEDIGWLGGLTIVAPVDAQIVAYGWAGGYGNRMILRAANVDIWLCHLAYAHVTGGHIAEGQQVAVMGATGNVAGVHLHWEVWVNGRRVDPAQWLADHTSPASDGSTPINLEENELDATEKKQLADIHAWLTDAANPNFNRIKAQNDITHAWLKGTVAPTLEKLLAFDLTQNQKLGTVLERTTTAVVDVDALADALAGKLGQGVSREQVIEIVNGARLVADTQ